MIKIKVLILLLVSVVAFAQQKKDSIYAFQAVEIKPIFPGGIHFFNKFVTENFVIPNSEEFKGGKLLVDFVIDTSGTLTDIRILRDIGFKTADQAKFILSNSEKWIPGRHNDKKVNVRYAMPIVVSAPEPKDPNIYETNRLDKLPQYPGGMEAFYKLIGNNFQRPAQKGVSGKIFASFVIEANGVLTEKKIIRDIGYGTGAELLRVLGLSATWEPGEINGIPVRTSFSLPVNVTFSD